MQSVKLRHPPYDFAGPIGVAVQQQTQALVVFVLAALRAAARADRRVGAHAPAAPTLYQARQFVEAGGLMSYGVHLPDMYQRAADYVDRILKGATRAALPVEQPTKFELVINLKTAEALGITIPPTFLFLADEVIR